MRYVTLPLSVNESVAGNRNRLNVIADILKVAMDEQLKTHIMYKANLSHRQLVAYLNYLLERGFLAPVTNSIDGRTRFRVTEEGVQFLKDYERVMSLLEQHGAPLRKEKRGLAPRSRTEACSTFYLF